MQIREIVETEALSILQIENDGGRAIAPVRANAPQLTRLKSERFFPIIRRTHREERSRGPAIVYVHSQKHARFAKVELCRFCLRIGECNVKGSEFASWHVDPPLFAEPTDYARGELP